MKEIYKVIPPNKIYLCSICNIDLGKRVATHSCFKECPYFIDSQKKLQFQCKQCPTSYANWRELANSMKSHKTNEIRKAYNLRKSLPVVDLPVAPSVIGSAL